MFKEKDRKSEYNDCGTNTLLIDPVFRFTKTLFFDADVPCTVTQLLPATLLDCAHEFIIKSTIFSSSCFGKKGTFGIGSAPHDPRFRESY